MGVSTQIKSPTPPEAPTLGGTLRDYAAALPDLLRAAQETAPGFATLQQDIQQLIAPITAGLGESLAAQAQEGMTGAIPEDLKQEYLSNLRAETGENISSPIGQEAIARNLLGFSEAYRDKFRNMGLSLSGRVPIATGAELASQYSLKPGQALGFAQGNYSTAANIYSTQANLAAQQAKLNSQGSPLGQMGGQLLGGALGAFTGGAGGALGSALGKNLFG